MRHRPALDSRLNLLVKLLGERRRCAATLALDDVVRAGLEQLGLKDAVEVALNAKVDDLDELETTLRKVVTGLEIEGEQQMMAS
ncbi:hypothetical protein SUDANB95_07963 (plasmid) [Actinosynnema sp. ALI-1.44]